MEERAEQEKTGRQGVTPLVEFHADDYGLFPAQSARILACREKGRMNAVSVLFNSPYAAEAVEALRGGYKDVAIAVHLNLMEGHSISPPETVGLLVKENGVFSASFGALLLRQYLPGRERYREQIKRELRAQIDAAVRCLGEGQALRLDSHSHYHLLPIVFDSMMEVIAEGGYPVEYIRIPVENCSLYLRHWSELEGSQLINLVKVAVLNVLGRRDMRKHHTRLEQMEQRLFLGVMFSGHMTAKNVKALLPDAKALARRKGMGLEVLAHPGYMPEDDRDIEKLTCPGDVSFMTSPWREREAEMFRVVGQEGEQDA